MVCLYDPAMQAKVTAQAALNADLHEALRANAFVLHYQPQVDHLGRVSGVEALVRWMHPKRGLIEPAGFIPAAEATGLIQPLGLWVLEAAGRQLAAWSDRPQFAHLSIAINVSVRQFRHPGFVDQVMATMRNSGVPTQRLKQRPSGV